MEAVEQLHAEEGGRPCRREPTHERLAPYLMEESYEVLDAIVDGDAAELGDLPSVLHIRCSTRGSAPPR